MAKDEISPRLVLQRRGHRSLLKRSLSLFPVLASLRQRRVGIRLDLTSRLARQHSSWIDVEEF
jgi:hypothetical protein